MEDAGIKGKPAAEGVLHTSDEWFIADALSHQPLHESGSDGKGVL